MWRGHPTSHTTERFAQIPPSRTFFAPMGLRKCTAGRYFAIYAGASTFRSQASPDGTFPSPNKSEKCSIWRCLLLRCSSRLATAYRAPLRRCPLRRCAVARCVGAPVRRCIGAMPPPFCPRSQNMAFIRQNTILTENMRRLATPLGGSFSQKSQLSSDC